MTELLIPATAPTFSEYQTIHQLQQEKWHPANPNRRPNTSDSFRNKVKFWLASVTAGGALSYSFGNGKFLGWMMVATLFTGLSLLYQWWEYHRAYRTYAAKPKPTAFTLTAEGVRVEAQSGVQYYRWESFYRVQQIQDWILFYTSVEDCYYLDLRQVQLPTTPQDVLNLLPLREVAVA
ncbi:hypothetical protein GCM10027346_10810 [Hymenobacter seoulensis]